MGSVVAFWREYAAFMAERQTQIWLWLVYFVLIGPTWLVSRAVGRSFFPRPAPNGSHWIARRPMEHSLAEMRRLG